MSRKREIKNLRTDQDLRFYSQSDPVSPQARYASTKLLIWGISLIICSPIGFLFTPIGFVIILAIGITLLIVAIKAKNRLKQLAKQQESKKQKNNGSRTSL